MADKVAVAVDVGALVHVGRGVLVAVAVVGEVRVIVGEDVMDSSVRRAWTVASTSTSFSVLKPTIGTQQNNCMAMNAPIMTPVFFSADRFLYPSVIRRTLFEILSNKFFIMPPQGDNRVISFLMAKINESVF